MVVMAHLFRASRMYVHLFCGLCNLNYRLAVLEKITALGEASKLKADY